MEAHESTLMNGMPSQLATWSEKTENNYNWAKNTADAICDMSSLSSTRNNWRIRKLYDAVHGIIHDEDYDDVVRPYGEKREELPNELRNYPLLNSDLEVLKGEKNDMGTNFQVITSNPDVQTEKEEAIMEIIMKETDKEFINELNRRGENTNIPSEETRDIKTAVQNKENSFKSTRAIQGQESLNYIYNEQELHHKFQDNWNHYLISGYTFTHKDVRNNDLKYYSIPPEAADYDKDSEVEFVEDGDWAMYVKLMYASTIQEMFYDELTEEESKTLENPERLHSSKFPRNYSNHSGVSSAYTSIDTGSNVNNRGMTGTDPHPRGDRLVEVIYVTWKARRKIGKLKYRDILGQIQEMLVDEDYKPRKELGEEVEWVWTTEAWECWKINNSMYKGIRPVPNQRNDLNNLSGCKLPMNGRCHTSTNSRNISFVELGLPYQVTYNIYKWKFNNAVSKAKDVMAMLDINIIPKGWSMDKWMYMVEKTGIGWTQYNKEGAGDLPPNHQWVLDLSLKTIDQYANLLNQIISEWERVSGISAQRRATMQQREGKAVAEQAIIQSSYMTDDYYRKFQRFEQRELQGLLDLSKIAWKDGKQGAYLTPRQKLQMFSVDGESHKESEYTVFVVNSRQEKRRKDQAESMIQPLLQNGAKASTALDILQSESFEKIQEKVKEAEDSMERMDQAIQKAQNEGYKKGKKEAESLKQRELEIDKFEAEQEAKNEAEQNEIENKQVEYNHQEAQEKMDIERSKNDETNTSTET